MPETEHHKAPSESEKTPATTGNETGVVTLEASLADFESTGDSEITTALGEPDDDLLLSQSDLNQLLAESVNAPSNETATDDAKTQASDVDSASTEAPPADSGTHQKTVETLDAEALMAELGEDKPLEAPRNASVDEGLADTPAPESEADPATEPSPAADTPGKTPSSEAGEPLPPDTAGEDTPASEPEETESLFSAEDIAGLLGEAAPPVEEEVKPVVSEETASAIEELTETVADDAEPSGSQPENKAQPEPDPESEPDPEPSAEAPVTGEQPEPETPADAPASDSDTNQAAETISQDDIDQLLQPVEDSTPLSADALLESIDTTPAAEEDVLDLISQEDIDALLQPVGEDDAGDESEAEFVEQEVPVDEGTGIAQYVTQADLDAAVAGAGQEQSAGGEAVSQDDIDALLQNEAPPATEPAGDAAGDVVSQDDIDALLQGDDTPAAPEAGEETAADNTVSQDDIDALLQNDAAPAATAATGEEAAADGAISQDDIDALLQADETPTDSGAGDTAEPEGVSQDDIDALLQSAESEQPGKDASDAQPAAADEAPGAVSQDDIDSLLSGAAEDEPAETEADDEQTSAEAFAKLKEKTETATEESGAASEDLVTQNQIDDLLKTDTDPQAPEPVEEAAPEPVILATDEETEEAIDAPEPEDAPAPKKFKLAFKPAWLRSKIVWGAAAGLVLLLGGIVGYQILGDDSQQAANPTLQVYPVEPIADAPKPTEIVPLGGVSVTLQNFVVLAPLDREDLTYLAVDLVISVADRGIANDIKEHQAYFRNIVYEELQKVLRSEVKSKIDPVGLTVTLNEALRQVLPEGAIKRLAIENFALT